MCTFLSLNVHVMFLYMHLCISLYDVYEIKRKFLNKSNFVILLDYFQITWIWSKKKKQYSLGIAKASGEMWITQKVTFPQQVKKKQKKQQRLDSRKKEKK